MNLDDPKLPCRIVCSVEGLEWFLYNNTPVYEGMKELLELETTTTTEEYNFSINKNQGNVYKCICIYI